VRRAVRCATARKSNRALPAAAAGGRRGRAATMAARIRTKRPRRRAAAAGGADLISDLDDDVLVRVLEMLPDTRHADAARTAALSRRWRDLWSVEARPNPSASKSPPPSSTVASGGGAKDTPAPPKPDGSSPSSTTPSRGAPRRRIPHSRRRRSRPPGDLVRGGSSLRRQPASQTDS
jgi:hypothetical protein